MAKRLVRARAKIATARIRYAIPAGAELPDRLAGVLAVVYLIATEAHAPTEGEQIARLDLEAEAVRLARLLAELMPDEPEVLSLLALLLFTAARTPARASGSGAPVTLPDQDRSLWDAAAIAAGSPWLARAVARSGGVAGPYQLQAHLGRRPLHRPELGADGLGPHRRPLRPAEHDHRQPGGGPQPGGRPHRAGRPRGRAGRPGGHPRPGALPPLARGPGRCPRPARPAPRGRRRAADGHVPRADRAGAAPAAARLGAAQPEEA